jgi:hypothetical protein
MLTLIGVTLFFVSGSFGRNGMKLYSAGNNLAWNSVGSWSLSANGPSVNLIPQSNDTIIITHTIVQNVNFTFSGQGILEILGSGILRGENLDLSFTANSICTVNGELKSGNLLFDQFATLNISESGYVSVINSYSNLSSYIHIISGKLSVSGSLSAVDDAVITGTGTVVAKVYSGNGTVFGINPVSDIPDGSQISEYTWIGKINSNWSETSNWSNGLVPFENSNISILSSSNNPDYNGIAVFNTLFINSQASLSLLPMAVIEIADDLTICETGKLILKNTVTEKSSLIVNGNASGKIFSEYPVVAGQNSLVSSPVDLAVTGTFLSMYLRDYNEASSQWGEYIVPTEDPLQVMRGYEVFSLFSETRVFEGIPNVKTKSFEISNLGNGLNLTGNPFPSFIDWESDNNDNWDRNSVAAAIYYPDPAGSGNFAVYMPGNDAAVSINNGIRYIAPMQGFFVKASQPGTLTVKESSRVRNFDDSRVVIKNNSIKLKLSGSNGQSDEALFRVLDNSSFQFDDQFDALKLKGKEDALSIHLKSNDDVEYAINTIPTLNSSTDIPVTISCYTEGMYTISSFGSFNFEYRYPVILEDKELSRFIDLRADSLYSFYHTPEMNPERFEIHFSSPEGIDQQDEILSEVIVLPGEVRITGKDKSQYNADFFTVDGKLISTSRGILDEGIHLKTGNLSGVFILRLTGSKNTMTKKIYIK